MILTDNQKELIKQEYKTYNDFQKVAQRLGIPVRYIKSTIYGESTVDPTSSVVIMTEEIEFGPIHMRPFTISRRRVDRMWPDSDLAAIKKAQRDYDEGHIEMCQGRSSLFFFLYAIPRKERIQRSPYFREFI